MIDRFQRYQLPTSVDEAADVLISDLTTQQMAAMTEMNEQEFDGLCSALIPHLQHDFKLWAGNDSLLMDCFKHVDNDSSTDPMRIIMERMRSKLQSLSDIIIAI